MVVRPAAKKKIAFVSSSAWTMYNFRKEVIQGLLSGGHDVLILAGFDKFAQLLIDMGCSFIPVTIRNRAINPWQDARLFFRLKGIYRQHRPDIVFHYVVKPNIYGTLAAGLLGIPSIAVITGLGYAFSRNGILKFVIKTMYVASLRFAREVWCLNKEDAGYLVSERMVTTQKIKILPGEGVNTSYFKNQQGTTGTAPFTFVMCARLLRSKGVLEYVTAAMQLQKKYPSIQCFLLGAQEDHPDAIPPDELEKWNKQPGFRYLGFIEDVREYLAKAHCFIYPSYYNEGVPRSLLEACSMQLPVITTDNIGCRELIVEGKNGFICAKKDAVDLSIKMEKMLLLDDVQRQKMGANSRRQVETSFSTGHVMSFYLQSLEQ